jgi:magnesium-transporting ATPase (P-type)
LRVLAEKLGLPFPPYPSSGSTSQAEGGLFGLTCNQGWAVRYERLGLLEFTRDRRMMSVLVKQRDPATEGHPNGSRKRNGTCFVYTKGAPESVLKARYQAD